MKVVPPAPQQGLRLLHVCLGLFPWADLHPSWVILQAENKLSILTEQWAEDTAALGALDDPESIPRGMPLKLLLFLFGVCV